MLFSRSRGPDTPPQLPDYNFPPDGRTSLQERKLAAWALTIGARVPLDQPYETRRRRGLPDIDLSGAGPDPGYRSPLRRLLDGLGAIVLRMASRPAPVATVSAGTGEGVGIASCASYIGKAGHDSERGPGRTGDDKDDCARPLERAA